MEEERKFGKRAKNRGGYKNHWSLAQIPTIKRRALTRFHKLITMSGQENSIFYYTGACQQGLVLE